MQKKVFKNNRKISKVRKGEDKKTAQVLQYDFWKEKRKATNKVEYKENRVLI